MTTNTPKKTTQEKLSECFEQLMHECPNLGPYTLKVRLADMIADHDPEKHWSRATVHAVLAGGKASKRFAAALDKLYAAYMLNRPLILAHACKTCGGVHDEFDCGDHRMIRRARKPKTIQTMSLEQLAKSIEWRYEMSVYAALIEKIGEMNSEEI